MFVRVSKSYIQFSQKLLVSSIIFFAALTKGRFFHPEFSDEAWRLLPGETLIKKKFENNISLHYTGRTPKQKKFSLASLPIMPGKQQNIPYYVAITRLFVGSLALWFNFD